MNNTAYKSYLESLPFHAFEFVLLLLDLTAISISLANCLFDTATPPVASTSLLMLEILNTNIPFFTKLRTTLFWFSVACRSVHLLEGTARIILDWTITLNPIKLVDLMVICVALPLKFLFNARESYVWNYIIVVRFFTLGYCLVDELAIHIELDCKNTLQRCENQILKMAKELAVLRGDETTVPIPSPYSRISSDSVDRYTNVYSVISRAVSKIEHGSGMDDDTPKKRILSGSGRQEDFPV